MGRVHLSELLQDPAAWQAVGVHADAKATVQVLQTHRSWIFLLGEAVLKLKKPLRDECVDFSSAAQRAHFCAEEMRLNERLAPGVCRALVAVMPGPHPGGLTLEPLGPLERLEPLGAAELDAQIQAHANAVDWLLLMRRLPADRMLDRLIGAGRIGTAHLDRIARALSAFWLAAPRVRDEDAYLQQAKAECERSHDALCAADVPQALRLADAPEALQRLRQSLQAHEALLRERVRGGHVLEGHGDLRPEHVFVPEADEPVRVIDALEFDARLRNVDPFEELSLLRLECARLGAGWIGEGLIARCASLLQDQPPAALLQLHALQKAVLRARLSILHLRDPQARQPLRWRPLAAWYLAAALQA